jgi:hypothetical protein
MSQADNLLNSLSDGVGYTVDPETEPHIVVGDDRYIIVPDELKRIAVQFDHDIETVTFDCPRYWDNHDMSEMKVYINYLLPNSEDGCYIAKNVTADGDLMHFDWTISRDVTLYKGNISFLVCVKKTDSDGNEERHWNSELCRDLYISEGLECEETVLAKHPDIITDLLTRMDTVEAVAVSAARVEGMAARAEYAMSESANAASVAIQSANQASEIARTLGDSFANPIKRTARGEVVRVDDVSPVEHTAHVTVKGQNVDPSTVTLNACGKNIAPIRTNMDTINGLNVKPNADGTIDISGAITGDELTHILHLTPFEADIKLKANVDYKLTLWKDGKLYDGTIGTRVVYDDTGTVVWNTLGDKTRDRTINYIYLFHDSLPVGDTSRCGTYKLQLEVGEEVTDWEPYKGSVYTPATDGAVDISAVYPTMTLYTDKEVGIDVEYNVDSNVYLQEIKNLINAGSSQFNANLTDTVTGDVYSLGVTNGKLTMTKLEV